MSRIRTEFFIARRISSRTDGRSNVMVRIATLTVAVGMTVMILALAVVMGFKREITAKLVGFGAHVRIVSHDSQHSFEPEPVRLDSAQMADLAALPRCASVAPYALKGGMIKTPDAIQGVALKGLAAGCDTAFLHGSLLRGRLPQLGGTRTKELLISENIARMGDVDSQKVIAAAQMAGVHSMVLGLPKGYDTQIGEHGAALSGGQRQRIGLARALYGDPRLVVLDEPNSNLDEEGEQQLARAVLNLKQRNATVVLVTHKPSILNIVDNIIVMQEGQIALSGPRQAVLEKLAAMRHQQEQAAQARMQQEKIARQQQALQKQQEALQKTQEAGGNA